MAEYKSSIIFLIYFRDTEEEVGFEKQKFVKQLEETIKQKEKEFQIKLDQNEAEIHSYQLKVCCISRKRNYSS